MLWPFNANTRLSPPLLQFVCTIIAILLQFFYMCVFSWLFLEGLHVYRMLSEVRDINYGPMRFYYLIGWGLPAIVTGGFTQPEKNSAPISQSQVLQVASLPVDVILGVVYYRSGGRFGS